MDRVAADRLDVRQPRGHGRQAEVVDGAVLEARRRRRAGRAGVVRQKRSSTVPPANHGRASADSAVVPGTAGSRHPSGSRRSCRTRRRRSPVVPRRGRGGSSGRTPRRRGARPSRARGPRRRAPAGAARPSSSTARGRPTVAAPPTAGGSTGSGGARRGRRAARAQGSARTRPRRRRVGELADAVHGVVVVGRQGEHAAAAERVRLGDELEGGRRVRGEDARVLARIRAEEREHRGPGAVDAVRRRPRGVAARVRVAEDAATEVGDVPGELRRGVQAAAGVVDVDAAAVVEPSVLAAAQVGERAVGVEVGVTLGEDRAGRVHLRGIPLEGSIQHAVHPDRRCPPRHSVEGTCTTLRRHSRCGGYIHRRSASVRPTVPTTGKAPPGGAGPLNLAAVEGGSTVSCRARPLGVGHAAI